MRCPTKIPLPLLLAILSVLVLMLPGCATSPGKLTVDLSALKECRRLGPRQPVPRIDADTDYRTLAAEALAGLNKANRGSAARTRCDDKVIQSYATAG